MKRSVYVFLCTAIVLSASLSFAAVLLPAPSSLKIAEKGVLSTNTNANYLAASSAIKSYYQQYASYFGNVSGDVNIYTDSSGTWYYQWYSNGVSVKAIVAYSDGNIYWLDGSNWHNTGQSWLPSTYTSIASSAIKAFYKQYSSYFGTAVGSVTSYTDATGTWYYQLYTNGVAIIAYSDGNLYWLDGMSWHTTGVTWQPSTDLSTATSSIQSFYAQYPTYFGVAVGSVMSSTDASGTWYYQWYSNGTAIIAYSDGNIYWFDGRSWNSTGTSWQPSTDLSTATSAIQSFYAQYTSVFGAAVGSVSSNLDNNGMYYFQVYVSGKAIIAYSDGNIYWTDGLKWYGTGTSWQPSSDQTTATSAIQSFYNQNTSYFGIVSGSVGSYTDATGTWYFQLYANGKAVIAYSDGNLYFSDGKVWYTAGTSWQTSTPLSMATSAIQSFYGSYPSYFGIPLAGVTTYTDSTGTWYFQPYYNGTAIIAYTDGNLYFSDGKTWYTTGSTWQSSTALTNASQAIQTFYSSNISYFGIIASGVTSITDSTGTWYFQLYYNGTAIIAYSDGNLYFSDGTNWYNTGVTWQSSSGGSRPSKRVMTR